MLKRDLDKLASKCARISLISFWLLSAFKRNLGLRCLVLDNIYATFVRFVWLISRRNKIDCQVSTHEWIRLNWSVLTGHIHLGVLIFAHDFRPLRANHRHKVKPLLTKLNTFKYSFFVNWSTNGIIYLKTLRRQKSEHFKEQTQMPFY